MSYSYVLFDTVSGDPLEELNLSDVRFNNGLNGVGSMNASIPKADPKATPDNLKTVATEVGVFRDGVPQFVGPLLNVQPTLSSDKISLTFGNVWWYMTRRTIELTLDYSTTPADLANVAWDILSTSNGKVPNGDVRITKHASYPASIGQTYSTEIPSYTRRSVAELMADLGDVYPGFDYMVQLSLASGASNRIRRDFQIYAPFKGVLTDQVITNNNGLDDFSYSEDGTASVNRVHELGAGEGYSQLIISKNASPFPSNLPMIETVSSRTDIEDLTLLGLYADADLFLSRWPTTTYSASFIPNPSLPYGFCSPGDTVPFDVTIGNYRIQKTLRVTNVEVQVLTSGEEKVSLTLNPPRA